MIRISLTALATIAIVASGHAADLSQPASSWTGVYLGADLGGRWSNTTWTSTALEDPVDPAENTFRLPNGNPAGFDSSTVHAGGYVGYNWQFAPTWVAGLEANLAWGDSSRTSSGIPGTWAPAYSAAAIALDSASVKEGWDGGVRGRLGFLVRPNVMLYGTGGVAWQDVSIGASCSASGPWCIANRSESFDKVMTGWTVGGGIETKIASNWLARFEYRYADFGNLSHEFYPDTIDAVFMKQSMRTQTVSFGIAYQFGSP